ncbi:AMP-binding protein [uncultured Ferrovibrio sp.]|jgi:acyl-coenzyme A synthetase/AMP-(fatty) acid ligase|uniref:acyl-CoA synthetase n=1 Tax=uncultured Ferrovibrio sp. TaxID=1576913 RepID=UPI0026201BC1|nr:AMP-binding protein [uncultured Ferrovibrio sp.]
MTEPVSLRFNIARYCLAGNVRRHPDKVAMILVGADREFRMTFGEVDLAVRKLAAGLQSLGLPTGSRIMIRMANDADYALTYFATMAAGYVALPSSAQLTAGEAAYLLENSGAAAVAASAELARDLRLPEGVVLIDPARLAELKAFDPLPDYADTAADDPAYLVYTSGTTGKPKGVLHAHRAAWGRRPMHQGWLGLQESDVMLHAGAFNWTYTLGVGLVDPWAVGATTVLYNGPRDVQVWPKLLEKHRATMFAAVPTLYRQILKYCDLSAYDLSAFRHGVTAGEALSPALLAEWQERTGKPLYEALGMSEISTYISTGPGMTIKPGSPGKPQPGRRVAILPPDSDSTTPLPTGEIGLLAVHRSDPSLMLGYWKRPEEEALVYRGEWFCGGDLASLDADGYLWHHGRNDDVMNAMGYRVSPVEVEMALAEHPAIAEVAVTELRVRSDVSVIAAFLVLREGQTVDKDELSKFAEARLAAYKCPREWRIVTSLPRTANGKVQRKKLTELTA